MTRAAGRQAGGPAAAQLSGPPGTDTRAPRPASALSALVGRGPGEGTEAEAEAPPQSRRAASPPARPRRASLGSERLGRGSPAGRASDASGVGGTRAGLETHGLDRDDGCPVPVPNPRPVESVGLGVTSGDLLPGSSEPV